jgi:hypothetical protein
LYTTYLDSIRVASFLPVEGKMDTWVKGVMGDPPLFEAQTTGEEGFLHRFPLGTITHCH